MLSKGEGKIGLAREEMGGLNLSLVCLAFYDLFGNLHHHKSLQGLLLKKNQLAYASWSTNCNIEMLDCVRPFQQCLFNVIHCDKMAFTT